MTTDSSQSDTNTIVEVAVALAFSAPSNSTIPATAPGLALAASPPGSHFQ